MDIPGLSMALAQNNTITKVGTAMLAKTMDTQEQIGEGLVQMIDAAAMEVSVNPSVGVNLDTSI